MLTQVAIDSYSNKASPATVNSDGNAFQVKQIIQMFWKLRYQHHHAVRIRSASLKHTFYGQLERKGWEGGTTHDEADYKIDIF